MSKLKLYIKGNNKNQMSQITPGPYTNVSAKEDIRWKNEDTNRWELSDKFEYV